MKTGSEHKLSDTFSMKQFTLFTKLLNCTKKAKGTLIFAWLSQEQTVNFTLLKESHLNVLKILEDDEGLSSADYKESILLFKTFSGSLSIGDNSSRWF